MYLEKLEIQGFKSFAHKTTLTFPKRERNNSGIAAIVGPNGSGKSNIADAVRWVLGEQSLKTLRGKKSEDVIFSGSGKKARLGFAEVALYLNNEDNQGGIDYKEIIIKRRLFRDGTSEYLINNSKVRLTDVQLLLAQANFGHRTYSVIGQGMVDAILAASAFERKEFFDEATGVKQYQIKREQALHKIEATEENLTQISALLREITPRLRQLERQKEKLEKRGALETKLSGLQLAHYGSLWQRIETDLNRLAQKRNELAQRHAEAKTETDKLSARLSLLEKEQKSAPVFEGLQKKYQEALSKKNEISFEVRGLEKELSALSGQAQDDKAANIDTMALVRQSRKLSSFLEKVSQAKTAADWAKLQTEAKALQSELGQLLETKTPDKDNSAKEKIAKHLSELKQSLASAAKEASQTEQALTEARRKEQGATSEVFSLQKNYQTAQQELSRLSQEKNQVEIELARVETRHEDLAEEISKETPEDLQKQIKNHPPAPSLVKEGESSNKNVPPPVPRRGLGGGIDDLWPQIARAKHELEMIGGIDPEIAQEYSATRERHEFLATQVEDLRNALEKTKQVEKELGSIIEREFNSAFADIEKGFTEYFAMLFGGGKSSLELRKENELENLNEEMAAALSDDERAKLAQSVRIGIEVKATPPGKRVSNINMLSGGERALTSIALICAIIRANPSPFVVLDEVDAALDEANSARFAGILEKLSHYTQFIAITHNRATMEQAVILYGITMGEDGVSKLLSVDLEKAVRTADLHR